MNLSVCVAAVLLAGLALPIKAQESTLPRGTVQSGALTPTPSPDRGVQPGDQVVLDFYTAAGVVLHEVSGERIVDKNGHLFLPYIGNVFIRDMTAVQIRELLVSRYESYYQAPVIDVQIKFRVNITGAVRRPGNYLVEPTASMVDVVSLAGGLGTRVSEGVTGGAGDASKVHLYRHGETSVFDLRAEEAEDGALGMPVISGDWIWVPAQPSSVWRQNMGLIGSALGIFASSIVIYSSLN
ncbi:MAG: polysaccharide biosynthesis/export family protein [Longimicrobiales bacterium]